jgi:hypothetical protein
LHPDGAADLAHQEGQPFFDRVDFLARRRPIANAARRSHGDSVQLANLLQEQLDPRTQPDESAGVKSPGWSDFASVRRCPRESSRDAHDSYNDSHARHESHVGTHHRIENRRFSG